MKCNPTSTYLCVGEVVGLAEGEALGLDVGAFVGDEDDIDDGLRVERDK